VTGSSEQPDPIRLSVYISKAAGVWDDAGLRALEAAGIRRNRPLGVTGRLVYYGGEFIQVIEGPPRGVDQACKTIHRDQCHTDIRLLLDTIAPGRTFSTWKMDVWNTNVARTDGGGTVARAAAAIPVIGAKVSRILALIKGVAVPLVSSALKETQARERSSLTVDRILAAARHLGLRAGTRGITFQAVAAQSNAGLKTIYRDFSSPSAIIKGLVRQRQAQRHAALKVYLQNAAVSSSLEMARAIADWVMHDFTIPLGMPASLHTALFRDYHEIAYGDLSDIVGDVLAAMRRNGLMNDDPSGPARLAMALASIAGAAKMTALHDRPRLREERFRAAMVATLVGALHGDASPRAGGTMACAA